MGNKFWEYCDTPSCPTKKRDCMCAADGSDYRGEVRLTVSGKECQRWDVQSPHTHTMTPSNYPNAGLASNYCRNPGGAMSGPYCYTTDPNTPFELCDIPSCGSDGSEYRGTLATTRSGRTCQRWDSQSPHTHTRTPANYPRGDLAGNNYCRNPDGDKGLCATQPIPTYGGSDATPRPAPTLRTMVPLTRANHQIHCAQNMEVGEVRQREDMKAQVAVPMQVNVYITEIR